MRDSRILIVSQRSLSSRLRIVNHNASRREPPLSSWNAAYVIFTSGSTGVLKGVVIEHAQLMSWVVPYSQNFAFSNTARVFQFASYAFDVCIQEIMPTLASGATVCIPSDVEREIHLVDAMHRLQITHTILTPTLFQNLDEVGLELPPSLHTLMLGGEAASSDLLERWATKVPRLIVIYGPTEATVCCAWVEVLPAWRSESHAIIPGEIGKPFGMRI